MGRCDNYGHAMARDDPINGREDIRPLTGPYVTLSQCDNVLTDHYVQGGGLVAITATQ